MRKRTQKTAAPLPAEVHDEERARWLFGFLHQDVDNLTPGQLLDAVTCVVRYLLVPNSQVSDDIADSEEYPTPTEKARLKKLQEELRAALTTLHGGKPWSPPPLGQTLQTGPGWRLRRLYKGSLHAVTITAATDLLVQFWPRVRRCLYKPCGKFFLQGHGNNKFHDPKCSQDERNSRRLPKNGGSRDYAEERRRDYERRPDKSLPRHAPALEGKRRKKEGDVDGTKKAR